jgi:DNA-binding response OmpR family regulator
MLFVDDDPLVRQAWSALLEREGWHVTQACDGEAGWVQFLAAEQPWGVVLTDLAMPQLDGRGLAQRIQEAGHVVPIILMSGHVGSDDAVVVGSQFAAVLHKPVDPEELFRVLAELCVVAPSGGAPESTTAA